MTDNIIQFPEVSAVDKQFILLEKQAEMVREQEERIKKLLDQEGNTDD